MSKEEVINSFTDIQDIGKGTAIALYNEGYTSYSAIVESTPIELNRECNINITNATLAIASTTLNLKGECVHCNSKDCFKPPNSILHIRVDTNSEVYCTECKNHGLLKDMLK